MVVEDSDLLFDPAYNHPNKETFAIYFFSFLARSPNRFDSPCSYVIADSKTKGGAGLYGQELEKGECLWLSSMILDHFKAAINPLPLKSHDFSVG